MLSILSACVGIPLLVRLCLPGGHPRVGVLPWNRARGSSCVAAGARGSCVATGAYVGYVGWVNGVVMGAILS